MKKLLLIIAAGLALAGIATSLLSQPQGNAPPPQLLDNKGVCQNPNCVGLTVPKIDCEFPPPAGYAWIVNAACYQQCFDTYLTSLIALKKQACDYSKQYEARWKSKMDSITAIYRYCKSQATTAAQVVQCRIEFFESMRAAFKEYDEKMATMLANYELGAKNLMYACIDCGNHNCCELVPI